VNPPITPFFEIGDKVHFFSFWQDGKPNKINGVISVEDAEGFFHIDTSKSSRPYHRWPRDIYYGWKEE